MKKNIIFLLCAFPISLFAQRSSFLAETGDTNTVVTDTMQNFINVMLLAVGVLAGIWVIAILAACHQLRNKAPKSLLFIIGLSIFLGSCTVEQRAMAAQNRAAMAKNHDCTCPVQHDPANYANAYFNNSYASNSNWQGPAFCKYCGHRILHRNR